MIRRFLCWLGLHEWNWDLKDTGYLIQPSLRNPDLVEIPSCATCDYCGAEYGET
jgi:hypothetical protein